MTCQILVIDVPADTGWAHPAQAEPAVMPPGETRIPQNIKHLSTPERFCKSSFARDRICLQFILRAEKITLALRICFCYHELVNFLTDSNDVFVTRL